MRHKIPHDWNFVTVCIPIDRLARAGCSLCRGEEAASVVMALTFAVQRREHDAGV